LSEGTAPPLGRCRAVPSERLRRRSSTPYVPPLLRYASHHLTPSVSPRRSPPSHAIRVPLKPAVYPICAFTRCAVSTVVPGGRSPSQGTAAGGSTVVWRRRITGYGPAPLRAAPNPAPHECLAESLLALWAGVAVGRAWHCASRPRRQCANGPPLDSTSCKFVQI
jgi:hypothetical protein